MSLAVSAQAVRTLQHINPPRGKQQARTPPLEGRSGTLLMNSQTDVCSISPCLSLSGCGAACLKTSTVMQTCSSQTGLPATLVRLKKCFMIYIRSNTNTSVDAHGGQLICTSSSFSTLLHPNLKARIQMSASFFWTPVLLHPPLATGSRAFWQTRGPHYAPPAYKIGTYDCSSKNTGSHIGEFQKTWREWENTSLWGKWRRWSQTSSALFIHGATLETVSVKYLSVHISRGFKGITNTSNILKRANQCL